MNLRQDIQQHVEKAIESGKNDPHFWGNFTTDMIIKAIMEHVPPETNIADRYETDGSGLWVTLDGPADPQLKLEFTRDYGHDVGHNCYRQAYLKHLKNLYKTPERGVEYTYD